MVPAMPYSVAPDKMVREGGREGGRGGRRERGRRKVEGGSGGRGRGSEGMKLLSE